MKWEVKKLISSGKSSRMFYWFLASSLISGGHILFFVYLHFHLIYQSKVSNKQKERERISRSHFLSPSSTQLPSLKKTSLSMQPVLYIIVPSLYSLYYKSRSQFFTQLRCFSINQLLINLSFYSHKLPLCVALCGCGGCRV